MSSRYASFRLAVFFAYVLYAGLEGRSVFAETVRPSSIPAASQPTSQSTGFYGGYPQTPARSEPSIGWYTGTNARAAYGSGATPSATPAQGQQVQAGGGFYGQYVGANTAVQNYWQNAASAKPSAPAQVGWYGGMSGQQTSSDTQQGTHWTPPAGTRYGFQGGYGSSASTYGGYSPQTPLPPGPANGARNDLWIPGAGSFYPGYLNRDGTVDQVNMRTGRYFFGIRNNQGSQDLYDGRQWYSGFRNPDGSIDYMSPRGKWVLSTGGGSTGP